MSVVPCIVKLTTYANQKGFKRINQAEPEGFCACIHKKLVKSFTMPVFSRQRETCRKKHPLLFLNFESNRVYETAQFFWKDFQSLSYQKQRVLPVTENNL